MKARIAYSLSFAIATVAFSACNKVEITPEKARECYKTYVQVTKEPKAVGAEFASMCGQRRTLEQQKKESGPHAMSYVQYYLNEAARHHRDAHDDGAYPPGSVIVK